MSRMRCSYGAATPAEEKVPGRWFYLQDVPYPDWPVRWRGATATVRVAGR